jgi:hypothetical protein
MRNWRERKSARVRQVIARLPQAVGLEANEYLRDRGQIWMGYAHRWKVPIPDDCPRDKRKELEALNAKAQADLDMFDALGPRKRHAKFVAQASEGHDRGLRSGMVRRRFHAFYNVLAWVMWETARGARTATENDSEDLTNLMHLAEPAFLLTRDRALIESVDESGSYQAPWVLRLEEFLHAHCRSADRGGSARGSRLRASTGRCYCPLDRCRNTRRVDLGRRGRHPLGPGAGRP